MPATQAAAVKHADDIKAVLLDMAKRANEKGERWMALAAEGADIIGGDVPNGRVHTYALASAEFTLSRLILDHLMKEEG